MNNFEKIIIFLVAFLIIAVLIFGVVIFSQQNAIRNLENGTAKRGAVPGQVLENTNTANKNMGLASVVNQFYGEIAGISSNELAVKAKLTDFSKPKDPEKMKNAVKNPTQFTADDFGTLEKNITVKVGTNTTWENNKNITDIKVGDSVGITADESPYKQDIVTAEKISIMKAR